MTVLVDAANQGKGPAQSAAIPVTATEANPSLESLD
jgi:hypothetical protein